MVLVLLTAHNIILMEILTRKENMYFLYQSHINTPQIIDQSPVNIEKYRWC